MSGISEFRSSDENMYSIKVWLEEKDDFERDPVNATRMSWTRRNFHERTLILSISDTSLRHANDALMSPCSIMIITAIFDLITLTARAGQ